MRQLFALVFLVSACGSASSDNAALVATTIPQPAAIPTNYSVTAETVDALPACNADRAGALAFVTGAKKFYACVDTAWTAVDVGASIGMVDVVDEAAGNNCSTGGKAILNGVDANGNGSLEAAEVKSTDYVCNGLAGSDNHISSSINCGVTISQAAATAKDLTIPATGIALSYKASLTNYGDIFVTGAIANGSNQIGRDAVYANGQAGSDTGWVRVADDRYNTSSFGYWQIELNRDTLILTATYTDSELPTTGTRVFTFVASSCTKESY